MVGDIRYYELGGCWIWFLVSRNSNEVISINIDSTFKIRRYRYTLVSFLHAQGSTVKLARMNTQHVLGRSKGLYGQRCEAFLGSGTELGLVWEIMCSSAVSSGRGEEVERSPRCLLLSGLLKLHEARCRVHQYTCPDMTSPHVLSSSPVGSQNSDASKSRFLPVVHQSMNKFRCSP